MIDVIQGNQDWVVLTSSLLLLLLSTVFLLLVLRAWRLSPKTLEAPRKLRTYRVHGVPVNVSADELCAHLGMRTPQAASYLTLASVSEKHAVATLTCQQPPDVSNTGYIVDTDFFGITPLTSPANADVDIITVPGLGSHALGSFRSSHGLDVWLRDFVPDDIPRARVLLYGYNTQLAKSKSKSSIGDLAKAFLETILAFRRGTNTVCRPVVFVCHSLGGLLVKEASALAGDNPERQLKSEFLRSTHGMMLFRVPNLSLRQDQPIGLVSGQPNERLINDLVVDTEGEPSPYLKELTQKFVHCSRIQSPTFAIISYFERKTSPTLKELANGTFEKSGRSTLLATEDSAARISLEDNFHQHLPLDTDHLGLVKFDRFDPNYEQVKHRLSDLVIKTHKIVSERFTTDQGLRL